MMSLGIVMLLAVWRSHVSGVLSGSFEAIGYCLGSTVIIIASMMYVSVLGVWVDRWLLHRRALLALVGSTPFAPGKA